eukprot:2522262-Prymnesium_polylepis.1
MTNAAGGSPSLVGRPTKLAHGLGGEIATWRRASLPQSPQAAQTLAAAPATDSDWQQKADARQELALIDDWESCSADAREALKVMTMQDIVQLKTFQKPPAA